MVYSLLLYTCIKNKLYSIKKLYNFINFVLINAKYQISIYDDIIFIEKIFLSKI